MDANDVVKTLERHSGKETKSGALGIMGDIASIKASGNDTVVIELTGGNADLPFLMTDYHLIIQPNGGFDDPNAGIGTGPYKVKVNEPGIRHVAERFDGYWRDDVGHADIVEIRVLNDQTARMSALQSGSVHMVNQVSPKTAKLLARSKNLKVINTSGRGHYPFLMHADTAPFDNSDLRLALKYAIDREDIVKRILQGYGSVGNDFPINAAYDLFDADIEQRAYDPDKAAFHYKKIRDTRAKLSYAHPMRLMPMLSTLLCCSLNMRQKPASILKYSVNLLMAIGQMFGIVSLSVPHTGVGVIRKTACTQQPILPLLSGMILSGSALRLMNY